MKKYNDILADERPEFKAANYGFDALSNTELLSMVINRGAGTAESLSQARQLMNQNFRLIKSVKLSEGGITETSVDIRILMREAVLSGATIMAFVHNHPSGNTQPSKADDVLTQQIAKACQVMRLFFMDHVIVTDGAFYSYHDKGRL